DRADPAVRERPARLLREQLRGLGEGCERQGRLERPSRSDAEKRHRRVQEDGFLVKHNTVRPERSADGAESKGQDVSTPLAARATLNANGVRQYRNREGQD